MTASTAPAGRAGAGSAPSPTAPPRSAPNYRRRPGRPWLPLLLLAILWLGTGLRSAAAGQNTLTWTDNATNEANQHIERASAADVPGCQATSGWTEIVTVGANVVTFTDTVVQEGVTYCYRVRASNPGGFSPYSNVAGRSVPFTIPAAPSGLTAGP